MKLKWQDYALIISLVLQAIIAVLLAVLTINVLQEPAQKTGDATPTATPTTAVPEPSPVDEPTDIPEPVELTNRELQDGKPFRMVVPNIQHPIVRIMMLGFFEACEAYDVDCEMAGIEFTDTSALLAQSEATISLGSSGVVHYPDATYYEVMKDIVAADIPVIGFHVIIPDELKDVAATAWVAPDSVDYSIRAADLMAEKVDCQGPIAVTLGGHNDIETPAAVAFTEHIKELCDGIEVLEPEEEGFEPATAIAKAAAILSANPDITGAYSTTGAGSTTWATALGDAGNGPGDVVVISMDYSEQNLDWVSQGWVTALVGQPLYEETYQSVELLIDLLHGEEIQFANIYPAPLIQKEDVDTYYAYGERVKGRWD
jgi:ribose transport system substrate-binding protein